MRLRAAIAALCLSALAAFHLTPAQSLTLPTPPQAPQTAQVAPWTPPAGARHPIRIDGLTPVQAAREADLVRFYAAMAARPAPKPRTSRRTEQAPQAADTQVSPPAPVDNSYDAGSVQQLILDVFGSAGQKALAVAKCESGYNPSARNGQYVGIFQIGNYHRARADRLGFTWEQVSTEAYANVMVAYDLYSEQGWRPWSCA